MQTTLCFDFGNTRLKCAVFNGADIKEVIVLDNDEVTTIQSIIQQHHATKSILNISYFQSFPILSNKL